MMGVAGVAQMPDVDGVSGWPGRSPAAGRKARPTFSVGRIALLGRIP